MKFQVKINRQIVFLIFFLVSCRYHPEPVVLISKADGTVFRDWLSQFDPNLDFIDMYTTNPDSFNYYISISSGIIISGGPDINPALFGKEQEVERCENIDLRRDTLEMRLIHYAMENKIPILGICRGEQMLNVANGGTLIIDIPTDIDTSIRHRGESVRHLVTINEGTFLHRICLVESDTVNSSHHQAVEIVAQYFRAAALAEDGLIEAIELANTSDHPFILGVQWHPERMDLKSPLAGPIAERFIKEVRRSHKHGNYSFN